MESHDYNKPVGGAPSTHGNMRLMLEYPGAIRDYNDAMLVPSSPQARITGMLPLLSAEPPPPGVRRDYYDADSVYPCVENLYHCYVHEE